MSVIAAARLAEVQDQLAKGEHALADLDAQRERLVANLLRLSGAVQVLTEVLAAEAGQVVETSGEGPEPAGPRIVAA